MTYYIAVSRDDDHDSTVYGIGTTPNEARDDSQDPDVRVVPASEALYQTVERFGGDPAAWPISVDWDTDPNTQDAHLVDESPGHDCYKNATPYESDGAIGHGWECGICGRFLQAG